MPLIDALTALSLSQGQPMQQTPSDLQPVTEMAQQGAPLLNDLQPYQKTEAGKIKFANDMYKMGLNLGLSEEAAKGFASQKALETNWGTKLPAPNNFGGVKARPGEKFKETMTTEDYGKGNVKLTQKFQSFKSPEEYQQRMNELFQLPRYKGVKEATSVEEYANAMVKGKYATDKQYAQKLVNFYKSINKRLQKP